MDGVSGTSVDTLRRKGEFDILHKYPGMHVVAEANACGARRGVNPNRRRSWVSHPWNKIEWTADAGRLLYGLCR